MTDAAETLHQALANFGITSAKDERSKWNTRSLYMFAEFIGDYDAHAAWELVRELRFPSEQALAL